MKLKRGLRKQFNELALELRAEVGIDISQPLCPLALCEMLEIPVLPLSHVTLSEADRSKLTIKQGGQFFACVVPLGDCKAAIVFNDINSDARIASDICHEVAHIVIGHELQPPALEGGERSYNARDEHEARELGMSVLLPKESCKWSADHGLRDQQVADHFGVSLSLSSYRMRITNARAWSYNARSKYQRIKRA